MIEKDRGESCVENSGRKREGGEGGKKRSWWKGEMGRERGERDGEFGEAERGAERAREKKQTLARTRGGEDFDLREIFFPSQTKNLPHTDDL